MKDLITLALAATIVTGVTASQNHHGHLHRHARRHQLGAPLERRAVVTKYVAAYETKYQNPDGSEVNENEAQKCIANGDCKVVGSVVPTLEPPPPPSTTSTTTSTQAAAFFEAKSSAAPTTTSESPPPLPVSTEPAKSEAKASSTSSSSSGPKGLDEEFPNDVPCSTFPSDYGAVPAKWVGINGWTTIQQHIGKYLDTPGVLIPKYSQANSGGCEEGDVCSYACPPGYDKTQWPEENQGAEGQSIGGLRCKGGVLVLTRPNKSKVLCAKGAGRVKVKSKLSKVVSICKTDYPANEKMSIPYEIQPGGEAALYNPRASETYKWKEGKTSAQYYVNPEGLPKEKACVWGEKGDNFGNFSPTNLGVGTNDGDETFIGLFANKPSTSSTLEFDIHVVVDGITKCTLKNGVYNGPNEGCTAGVLSGQEATIYLLNKGDSP